MKLKVKPSKAAVVKAGIFPAEVVGIQQDEKKNQWSVEFKLPNSATLRKDYPLELEEEDLAYREIKKILGRDVQLDGEFDLDQLKGARTVIVVGSKRTTGGRTIATVALIMTPEEFKAAAEAVTKQINQNAKGNASATPA